MASTRDKNSNHETRHQAYSTANRRTLRRFVQAPLAAAAAIVSVLAVAPSGAEAQASGGFVDHCWIVADSSAGTGADWLSEYDLATDTETPAAIGTGTTNIEAIAFHYPTSRLFTTNQGQFGEIDLTPGATFGAFTPIGAGGLGDVDGLAFDSTTGNLWGTVRLGGNDQLIRIDFNTGSQIGAAVPIAATTYSGPLNGGATTNLADIDDLAIDPVTGTFYAIANGAGALDMLVTIDPATGATTPVGSPAESGVQDIEGLGFTPAGELIGTSGSGGGAVANSIVDINLVDGSASLRNDALAFADHEAVDCLTNAYLDPSIGLEKATNTIDADTPSGPVIAIDGTVTWTYEITNTGNLALFDLTLSDDVEGAVTCAHPQPLFPGESTTCTLTAASVTAGQYANIGTIVGTPIDLVGNGYVLDPVTGSWFDASGNPADFATLDVAASSPLTVVDATDPSHYIGADPQIDIEKATNGVDADSPTGPSIVIGDVVTWTYEVTNPGTVPVSNVVVNDDNGTPADTSDDFVPTFVSGDVNNNSLLDLIETWVYTAEGVATAGQYMNNGTVTGVGPDTVNPDGSTTPGVDVADEDPSHYLGTEAPVASIDIEKDTNGTQADLEADNVALTEGADITWTYEITNTGGLDLVDVVVTDDVEGPVCTIASLAIGETTTCTLIGTAGSADYRNIGSVTGQPVDDAGTPTGDPVTDADASGYDVTVVPTPIPAPVVDLSIVKTVDGVLTSGSTGTYVLTVSNLGPDTATQVTVVDVLPTGLTFRSATGDGWTCSVVVQTVTCTRPSVSVGETVPPIRLSVNVASDLGGRTIINTARVSSTEQQTVPENDESSVSVTVTSPPARVSNTPLAFTGSETTTTALIASIMIGTGLLLNGVATRKREEG